MTCAHVHLSTYGNIVMYICLSAEGLFKKFIVPSTEMCRGYLSAINQIYASEHSRMNVQTRGDAPSINAIASDKLSFWSVKRSFDTVNGTLSHHLVHARVPSTRKCARSEYLYFVQGLTENFIPDIEISLA
jgi:hypothetical protein